MEMHMDEVPPRPRASGLEGVIAAETRLSAVDGTAGRLVIAGRPVEALVREVTFPGACALLLGGDAGAVATQLGAARAATHARLGDLGVALDQPDPMDALAAAAAQLRPRGEGVDAAHALVGSFPVIVGAWARGRRREAAQRPDPRASHAEDALRLLHGRAPSPAEANALDAYWVTVIDHGLNASTFAARVVASTGSDLSSAVIAALGALQGPLHGGAPGPVLDMLDAIETPEHARAWLTRELEAGRRIMGMGHRVYRVRDPRAAALEEALRRMGGDHPRLALARAVEREAEALLADRKPERTLRANVEFATATLLEGLAVPREAFTAFFACGRVAGWCAHAQEQAATGRLLRPRARYVGDWPEPATASGHPPSM